MQNLHWKQSIDDLRGHAAEVIAAPAAGESIVSARQAAAILSGICGLVARRHGVDVMQQACAELARLAPMDFGNLPAGYNGAVPEQVSLIASVARSIRPLAGENNLRAALSFWATEEDPAVWNLIAS